MPTRDTTLWHPFADMAAVRGGEFVIVRGEGAWLFDESGRRYLDGSASLWYCNVGHGRAEIADAAARQMRAIAAYNNYGDVTTPPTSELAESVASIAPTSIVPSQSSSIPLHTSVSFGFT